MVTDVRYDPLDPQTLTDPYPLYAELRARTPIFWHEQMQSWVVTRYSDCRDVLRNYDSFAQDPRRLGEDVPAHHMNIQSLDPPEQGPLRSLFVNTLKAQDFDAIGLRARRQIAGIFDEMVDRDEFNWMTEVAAPVALTITAELLGVDEPDLAMYVELADALTRRMDAGLLPGTIEAGDRARKQLNALVDIWFETQDRPGALADVRRNAPGVGVPEIYIHNTTAVTFNASFGTVYAMAGNAALTLLRHPETLGQLSDESLLPTAVNELIRFDGPAQGTARTAVKPTRIGDVVVEPGQTVVTLMASANRDPDEFPEPDRLKLDRTPNRHLGFGWGPHACLGAQFGQLAIKELILGIQAAPRPLRLVREPIRRDTATVRSMDVLPVTFRP